MKDYSEVAIPKEMEEDINKGTQFTGHIPRKFRRLEKKRTADWNKVFQQLSLNFAMGIITTDGNFESEEVQKIFTGLDKSWRSFVRPQFNRYKYVADDKKGREKYLNAFRDLCIDLCTRRSTVVEEQNKEETYEVYGHHLTLSQLLTAFSDTNIKTSAKTAKGLLRKIKTLDEAGERSLKVAIKNLVG